MRVPHVSLLRHGFDRTRGLFRRQRALLDREVPHLRIEMWGTLETTCVAQDCDFLVGEDT